jgi:hypothetical protein
MRHNLLLSILIALCLPLLGNPVDEATAKQLANNFWKENNIMGVKGDKVFKKKMSDARFVNVAPQCGYSEFFIFNNEDSKGFVIIAADDWVIPILGYSYDNNFVAENLPPNLKGWLDSYAEQIRIAVETRAMVIDEIREDWECLRQGRNFPIKSETSVSPLITTKWDQNYPYNYYCPYNSIYSQNTCAGCVATAMAQIMKYYNYPTTGTGSYSYEWNGQMLTAEPGMHTYNWSKMLPNYSTTSFTNENAQAVAQLMYDCGVVCDAGYGANLTYAGIYRQFVDYFGYDSSSAWMYKNQTSNAQWERIINDELQASRPVYYCAQNNSHEGHLFIVDGYDNNNYFHINWGWGGYKDAYFTLTLPEKLGDYWDRPSCIIGLKPGTETSEPDFTVALPYTLQTPISTMTGAANYGFIRGNFANHSTQDQRIERGVRFTSATTGKTYYYE